MSCIVKDNEGADGSADARIPLNGSYEYTWNIDEAAGPGPSDPSTIVSLYYSHLMSNEEVNLGLVGGSYSYPEGYGKIDI